jgi:hypothetical protein
MNKLTESKLNIIHLQGIGSFIRSVLIEIAVDLSIAFRSTSLLPCNVYLI